MRILSGGHFFAQISMSSSAPRVKSEPVDDAPRVLSAAVVRTPPMGPAVAKRETKMSSAEAEKFILSRLKAAFPATVSGREFEAIDLQLQASILSELHSTVRLMKTRPRHHHNTTHGGCH
jgi:hypothetical protein